MLLTKELEAEIKKVMDHYWKTYLTGDIDTWASHLAEGYLNIGTTQEEIWKSKKQIIDYTLRIKDQLAGLAEVRDKDVQVFSIPPYFMAHEVGNMYLKMEDGWTFYGKLRLSSLMEKTAEGWKILHQHGSYPDVNAEEGDSFGLQALNKENTQLRDAVKRRTTELEIKNRELEIEAALERVRTVAMSMKEATDMLQVCKTISQQLELLGVGDIRNVQTAIFYESGHTYMNYEYYAKHDKVITTETTYTNNEIHKAFAEQMLKGEGEFFITHITGHEVKDWIAYQETTNVFIDDYLRTASSLNYYWFSLGTVALGISTYRPLKEEEAVLFKRFLKVFELSYKRYQDIEKAESQAKEAQIQLALERVRARTMAMQHSDELAETAFVLFQQIKDLGFETWSCGFCIWKNDTMLEAWMGADAGSALPPLFIPYKEEQTHHDIYKAHLQGMQSYDRVWEGQELVNHYNFLETIPSVKKALDILKELNVPLPSWQCYYVGFFKQGYLLLITKEPSNELKDLSRRFAQVFDLTYTRFLDLQKAEAQAKESQIQLALERVRARTMAMQHSHELADASFLLDSQVRALGIQTRGCAFNIYGEHESTEWFSSENGALPVYKTPRENLFLRYYEAGLSGTSMHIEEFAGEDCAAHYEYLCTIPIMGDALRAMKAAGGSFPERQIDHATYFKYGYLLFITLEPVPDAHEIFIRFAKVFEQTYTRFLDLQKAEAQAREARIEASLEKVRSKTMAMHNSQDVGETVHAMFDEFNRLGIHSNRCGILIFSGENNAEVWTARLNDSGKAVTTIGKFRLDFHDLQSSVHQAWLAGKSSYQYILEGELLTSYYDAINKSSFYRIHFDLTTLPKKEYHNDFFFAEGAVFTFSLEPIDDETGKTIKRFAAVFGQTYRRYLDLQKAESQAREAQIEVALERVRAKAMAMHKTEDLHEAVATVFEELNKLDMGVLRVGISVLNKETRTGRVWVTSVDEDKAVQVSGDESFDFHPLMSGSMDAWINQRDFYYILEGEDLVNYYKAIQFERFVLPTSQVISSNEFKRQAMYVAIYNAGGVYAFRENEFSEEAKTVMRRFAGVFDLTYKRFLDLQKAEAQTREAQIEAALERVRSRTLAMQKSEELAETAAVLFQQLIGLGIEPNRLYISIVKNETGDTEFWITDEDGTKVSTAFSANLQKNATFIKMYEGWKQQQKSLVIDMQGEELENYFRHLSSLGVPFKGGLEQKRRVQDIAYFSNGFIGMASTDIQPSETLQLLERFAAVFNLTFTRFNDLKIAEAHAQQAEKDLVEIKSAREKAEAALSELQLTQKQLIQSEKMASLGELTAGIAHEIQNPLNFVNNFSELSNELIAEVKSEKSKVKSEIDETLIDQLLADVSDNLQKINFHGKRADAIVKGMLQHSRTSAGQKELTDVNALCDEYLRLAYHGLRAKDSSFNAKLETDFERSLPAIQVLPQDIGRVILNLITNAFHAVTERQKTERLTQTAEDKPYQPRIVVSTKSSSDADSGCAEIMIADNGNGIPSNIIDKIFQPFFTTKPTGQGTGLGLSLSYDIVKAHGGELKVETKEGEGTTFIIKLPIV